MGRPIKSDRSRQPPATFKVSKYEPAETWGPLDWWQHLVTRRNIASFLVPTWQSLAPEIADVLKAKGALDELLKAPTQHLHKNRAFNGFSPSKRDRDLQLNSLAGVRSMTGYDLSLLPDRIREQLGNYLLESALSSFVSGREPSWIDSPLDKEVASVYADARQVAERADEKDKAGLFLVERSILRACVVNLDLPDDKLVAAFRTWLKETRKVRLNHGYRRLNAKGPDALFQQRVLPAIDLRLCELAGDVHFGRTSIIKLLWPDEEEAAKSGGSLGDRYKATWSIAKSVADGTLEGNNLIRRLLHATE